MVAAVIETVAAVPVDNLGLESVVVAAVAAEAAAVVVPADNLGLVSVVVAAAAAAMVVVVSAAADQLHLQEHGGPSG